MQQLALRAESHGHSPTEVEATVLSYEASVRARRAVVVFVPLAAGALLALPIPGVHFIATPGLAFLAFQLGRQRLRQRYRIDAVRGPCPACHLPQDLPVAPTSELPVTLPCPSCGEFLKLREVG
jgi:hypothetical protein